jgi:hypothetical protein
VLWRRVEDAVEDFDEFGGDQGAGGESTDDAGDDDGAGFGAFGKAVPVDDPYNLYFTPTADTRWSCRRRGTASSSATRTR